EIHAVPLQRDQPDRRWLHDAADSEVGRDNVVAVFQDWRQRIWPRDDDRKLVPRLSSHSDSGELCTARGHLFGDRRSGQDILSRTSHDQAHHREPVEARTVWRATCAAARTRKWPSPLRGPTSPRDSSAIRNVRRSGAICRRISHNSSHQGRRFSSSGRAIAILSIAFLQPGGLRWISVRKSTKRRAQGWRLIKQARWHFSSTRRPNNSTSFWRAISSSISNGKSC